MPTGTTGVQTAVRVLLFVALLWGLPGSTARAQGGDTSGQQQRRPPAQSTQATITTSSLSGMVLASDTGRPVRRARVLITAAELPGGRAITTGDDGTYEATELPAGRYSVAASKTGYVTSAYGQRRPGRPGTPVQVGTAQKVRGIDVRLVTGGVITGHVSDDMNDPLARVLVRVARYQYAAGQRTQTVVGTDQTDDRGEYRVYGLTPGTYFVSAVAPAQPSDDAQGGGRGGRGGGGRGGGGRGGPPGMMQDAQSGEDAPVTYVPTYYPGVANAANATAIVVTAGRETGGIDFPLQQFRAVRVSGIVTGGEGELVNGGQVFLAPEDSRGAVGGPAYSARVGPDSSFTIANVATGRYVLTARVASNVADPMFASQPLAIGDQDVSGVNVLARSGGWLSGSASFQSSGDTRQPGNLNRVRILGVPLSASPFGGRYQTSFNPDGTFLLDDVSPGTWTLSISGLPAPWTLKGIYLGSRDLTDGGLEATAGNGVEDLSLVFTDQPTTITGIVESAGGMGLNDYAVIAFSTDKAQWRPQSRRVRVVRSDQSGNYRIDALPAGNYYLAVTDDVDEGEWYEPAFLESLRETAIRISVGEGETKSQTLRVRNGSTP